MFTYNTDKLVSDVNRTIETYLAQDCDIIYIKHVLSRLMWGVGFSIKGTEGAELYPGLKVVSDLIFEKNRSDSYTSKAFRAHMQKVRLFSLISHGYLPTSG
ncbi:MAG: hypothetical protein K6E18_01555 [Lachnospiraceae bacterium]|nr:hypothetical protein [Lachnospiraceae bacterium]